MANVKSRLKAPKSASTKKGRGNAKKSLTGPKKPIDATVRNDSDTSIVMKRPSNRKLLTSDEKVHYLLQHGHLLRDKFVIKPSLKNGSKSTDNIGDNDISLGANGKTANKPLALDKHLDHHVKHGHVVNKFTMMPNRKGRPKKSTETFFETKKSPVKNKKAEEKAKEKRKLTRSERLLLLNKALKNPPLSRTKSGRIKKKNKESLKLIDNILKSELMIQDRTVTKKKKKVKSNVKTKEKPNSVNNNNDIDITDQNNTVTDCNDTSNTNENLSTKEKSEDIPIAKTSVDDKNNKVSKAKQVTLSNGVVLTLAMFECDLCKKVFNRKSSLRRHMYLHLGMKPYSCRCCKKKYRKRTNLNRHVARLHAPNIDTSEHYVCHVCDKPFLLKENLDLHMIGHVKNENSFKCMYCDKKFSYNLLLVKHEKQHLVTGRYQCTLCPKNYECRNLLYLHVKSHLKIKDYICQYCGKDFLRQNSMRRHVEICHGGQRVQCPICKKNLKGHLTEHMRTHDNKRPHECPDCGQRFTQSTQLTVHRRSHSGARPYPCRICDRPFTHSNALMLHIRRHTGEKPFSCAMCPISFSQLPHMKAHMRKIHGKENPYKCPKCHQFFKLKAQLEGHAKTCTVGDVEKSFEEKLNASVVGDGEEIESIMSLSRMRFLLALLLTMIASKEKLKFLGFNKRLIDDLLIESLEAMGQTPCKDETLSPLMRLKTNIEMLMIGTVPKDQMEKFRSEKKTTEELLELLTSEK